MDGIIQENSQGKSVEQILSELVQLTRRMLSLAGELRAALKKRDVEKFHQVSRDYQRAGQEFLALSEDLKRVWPDDLAGANSQWKALKDELAGLVGELKEINRSNLVLIRASAEVTRFVLQKLNGTSSHFYGELGGAVEKNQRPLVLDRMI